MSLDGSGTMEVLVEGAVDSNGQSSEQLGKMVMYAGKSGMKTTQLLNMEFTISNKPLSVYGSL